MVWLWPAARGQTQSGRSKIKRVCPGERDEFPDAGHRNRSNLIQLAHLMLAICGVIFVGVFGVMFYSIFAHRKSKGRAPAHFHENMAVEILWTAAPLLIIVLMALP